MPEDQSNGYEEVAEEFVSIREKAAIGLAVVRRWAASLPKGSTVVDIGAGSGEPLTSALIEEGLAVSAIDASPTLVAVFQNRFPEVEVACEPAERSRFFDRKFDAALAVGLIFLLPADSQRELIRRISGALERGGRLLFSAPRQVGTWDDLLTGRPSTSLGEEEYRRVLASSGLRLLDQHVDEGGSHYFEAEKSRA